MIVLKATETQFKILNGFTNGNSILNFVKDSKGNWIVGLSVLTDDAFLGIRSKLQSFKRIEFTPILETI